MLPNFQISKYKSRAAALQSWTSNFYIIFNSIEYTVQVIVTNDRILKANLS